MPWEHIFGTSTFLFTVAVLIFGMPSQIRRHAQEKKYSLTLQYTLCLLGMGSCRIGYAIVKPALYLLPTDAAFVIMIGIMIRQYFKYRKATPKINIKIFKGEVSRVYSTNPDDDVDVHYLDENGEVWRVRVKYRILDAIDLAHAGMRLFYTIVTIGDVKEIEIYPDVEENRKLERELTELIDDFHREYEAKHPQE